MLLFWAFLWGYAEATLFFIVPDVLLTYIALRSLRIAWLAAGFAVAGALLGGLTLWYVADRAPGPTVRLLDRLPGISRPLMDTVRQQVHSNGEVALLLGPTRGIPYKLYAAEWSFTGRSLGALLLISVPARGIRFFLAPAATRAIAVWIRRWTDRRAGIEVAILTTFWITFYAFYFAHFGI